MGTRQGMSCYGGGDHGVQVDGAGGGVPSDVGFVDWVGDIVWVVRCRVAIGWG